MNDNVLGGAIVLGVSIGLLAAVVFGDEMRAKWKRRKRLQERKKKRVDRT